MRKRDLVASVFYFQIRLFSMLNLPHRGFTPTQLFGLTMKKLFFLCDCICRKIIKVQNSL